MLSGLRRCKKTISRPDTGGCDASNIALHDIAVVNIGTGMRDVHTTAENISIKDMEDSTRFLCELLKA